MDARVGIGSYHVVPSKELYEDKVPLCHIYDVLDEASIDEVAREARTMPLEVNCNDMCSFKQSEEFGCNDENLALCPVLKNLKEFFKTQVRETVREVFQLDIQERITMTVSKYSKGDYLLCHDDLMGTRAVAFVLYLSTLVDEDGGHLRFFRHDVEDEPISNNYMKITQPVLNSMVLFRVDKESHHEVEQVFTGTERLTINGWFHVDAEDNENDAQQCPLGKGDIDKFTMPMNPILKPEDIVDHKFLKQEMINEMSVHLKEAKEKVLVIDDFLQKQFFDRCILELETNDLAWETKGPANYRFYDTIPYCVEGPHVNFGESLFCINNLIDMLLSPMFLQIFADITGVQYAIIDGFVLPPMSMIEVQRWREGNYSLLCDKNIEQGVPTLEVMIFFSVNERILGSADSESTLSGNIVLTEKSPMMEMEAFQGLSSVKLQRMRNAWSGAVRSMKLSKRQKDVLKKKFEDKSHHIVQQKVEKIKQYRDTRPYEVSYLTPASNRMIISLSSSNTVKYTSYIRKGDPFSEPDVCYYAVSMTYFVT